MTPCKASQPPAYRPRRGEPARDAATGFVGLFQSVEDNVPRGHRSVTRAYIRPYGGGVEVETDPAMLREPTPEEILSARVAAENRRSRQHIR